MRPNSSTGARMVDAAVVFEPEDVALEAVDLDPLERLQNAEA